MFTILFLKDKYEIRNFLRNCLLLLLILKAKANNLSCPFITASLVFITASLGCIIISVSVSFAVSFAT